MAFTILPPSSGRRCPEGAEVGFPSGVKKNVRYAFPRFVHLAKHGTGNKKGNPISEISFFDSG